MPILYDEGAQTLTLHTAHTTYQMKVAYGGILLHTYYGASAQGDMSYAIQPRDRGFSGNPFDAGMDRTISLDTLPQEYPCEGSGDYRATAFGVRDSHGVSGCDLRYVSHSILPGKYGLAGMPAAYAEEADAQTLEVLLSDKRLGLEVKLLYGVLPRVDCITRAAIITNRSGESLTLENAASTCVDFLHGSFDLISFYGRHNGERQTERAPLKHAEKVIGSRRGSSSHQQNPFVVLCEGGATEESGMCLGLSLLWSGSFALTAGMDYIDQTRVLLGVQSERFNYELAPGECFTAPEAAMILTNAGLADMSQRFHRLAHEHVIRGPWRDVPNPVLINNWEATYADFDGEKLLSIASKAAELGVEMMVLDDGWFGRRNDDHDGLGDWVVNEKKLGCTMKELSAEMHKLGMRFGLWIEPEMVNMASDLYHEHPDWVFTIPGKPPVRSRDQLVLDFSRKEVVDYIAEKICGVLDGCSIDYVKMDMNRSVGDVYTHTNGLQSQGKVLYHYVLGVYRFMEQLLQANPGLLLEGCSGGGGRFDLGMLYYTPQIWCSDNTDPIERLRIQYGTSFGYPISTMGAHVSTSPNHQTGRATPLKTRGVVAMAGTFGYELDLNLLTDAEKLQVTEQIRTFKRHHDLIRNGLYYRLSNCMTDRDASAWMMVAQDLSEALVSWVTLNNRANGPVCYVVCKGLDAGASYRDTATERVYSGAALMQLGLPIPLMRGEYQSEQVHLVRV